MALILGLDDSQSYTAAVQHAWTNQPVYAAFQLSGPYLLPDAAFGRGFVYPPTAIVPLTLYGLGPPVALLLDLAGITALLVVLLAMLPRSWPGRLIALLMIVNPITADTVRVGAVTPWLAAGLGLMWLRPASSGYVSVFAGAVKIYPLAGLAWAWRKRAPLSIPLTLGAAILTMSLFWGWPAFLTAWANGAPACWALPSFACAGVPWLGYLVAGVLVIGAVFADRDDVAFALLSLGMVAAAPDMWLGYLLIPAVGYVPFLRRLAQELAPDSAHVAAIGRQRDARVERPA